ncbi:MAG: glycosyltransferase [Gammaproteobacteria bacterium]
MADSPEIPVLVPTLATTERRDYLLRALDSILGQRGCRGLPVVIVNGDQSDAGVVAVLERMPVVRVLRLPAAHMGAALAAGRRALDAEVFAELDDDDELLPDALATRLARLRATGGLDVVVSNSLLRGPAGERESIPRIAAVEREPLVALMDRNWLIPGAALFRTAAIPADWFAAMPRYLEWTSLALRLCQWRRLAFLPEPTVIHHEGHEFSVEASVAARLGSPAAFDELLAVDMPPAIRRRLHRKRTSALHTAAEACRAGGNLGGAWRAHLASLVSVSGWRFLPYTRYLLKGRPR